MPRADRAAATGVEARAALVGASKRHAGDAGRVQAGSATATAFAPPSDRVADQHEIVLRALDLLLPQ